MSDIRKFYELRSKDQDGKKKTKRVDYDKDGNLVWYGAKGEVVKQITLPTYRPPSDEEIDQMERVRMAAIAEANQTFEQARMNLYDAVQDSDNMPEILRLNRLVAEADHQLQTVRFPLREAVYEENIPVRRIDFDQPTEVRKYRYGVRILETAPFTLQDQFVRIGEAPSKPLVSVAEAKAALPDSEKVILFSEPSYNEYGYLSMAWKVDISFENRPYHSVKQALAGEVALYFGDEDRWRSISSTLDDVSYNILPEEKEEEWSKKMIELLYPLHVLKFKYPDLQRQLIETKTAILGAYMPDDTVLGIGISINDPKAINYRNWTGKNELGKVIMRIRDEIRATAVNALKPKKKPTVARRPPSVASAMPLVAPAMPLVASAMPLSAPPMEDIPIQMEPFPQVAIPPQVASLPPQVASLPPQGAIPQQVAPLPPQVAPAPQVRRSLPTVAKPPQ